MKVLLVHQGIYVYGGAEHLLVELCNHLTRRGIKHALLTTMMLDEMRADLKDTPVLISEDRGPKVVGEVLALRRGIKKHAASFDVINPHNYPADMSFWPLRKPAVWMCNEPALHLILQSTVMSWKWKLYCNFMQMAERYIVPRAMSNIVVADEFNFQRFKRLFGIEPRIINYGIDYKYFQHESSGATRQSIGIEEDDFAVLQVGMLTSLKNQMESLKTVARLKDSIPSIKLILAGYWDEEYLAQLKEYIEANGLEGHVKFLGHIKREQVRDLFHLCDVLLHPVGPQGGWLSPFEALSAGCPIVVSSRMTAADIIERQKVGVVTEDFVKAIGDVYEARDKYREMALHGQKWVMENLSWELFGDRMIESYQDAMDTAKK
jgi:glycosyltransferase involved in cell wall biosynthesis